MGAKTHATVGVLAIAVVYAYNTMAPHVTHRGRSDETHPYHVFEGLWTADEVNALFANVVRSAPLQSTTQAYTKAVFDNIGEKVDALPDGSCASPYLTPTHDKKSCIFPERVDVARHQMMSGGIDARKERYNTAVSRLVVMQRYYHAAETAMDSIPEVAQLFKSQAYLQHAETICDGRPHLVPMTLAVIVSVPGQMVAMHYDLPWFLNADRYQLPGWLLAVMQTSGLFRESRIPQVQGVAYLHRWNDTAKRRGGFYFYANGTGAEPLVVPAAHNTAIICDGTEMAHGTQTYMQEAGRTPMTKDASFTIEYTGGEGDLWTLKRDGKPVRTYREDELRITLVWRQHCFRDAAQHAAWEAGEVPGMRKLTVDDVLEKLSADLARRGLLATDAVTGAPVRPSDPKAFMELLIDTYVRYPYPSASWFPYNVCGLDALVPRAVRWIWHALCP